MNRTTERLTQDQVNKLQQLEHTIAQTKAELSMAEAELNQLDARLFAANRHLFTLTFPHGERAILEVCGAPHQIKARTLASSLFHCPYTVTDGDVTNGDAPGSYRCWYSSAAQELQLRRAEDIR